MSPQPGFSLARMSTCLGGGISGVLTALGTEAQAGRSLDVWCSVTATALALLDTRWGRPYRDAASTSGSLTERR
jgi:hypothetical protein